MQLKNQNGSLMVELLIGLAIAGAVLGFVLRNGAQADSQTTGRMRADTLSSFQQLAEQYFSNNRDDIEAAMAGDVAKAAAHCRINVAADGSGGTVTMNTTKHTCAFDSTLLRAKGLWTAGMNVNVTGANRYVAIFRQLMSTDAVPVPTGTDEMLVVMAQLSGAGDVMTSGSVTFNGDASKAIQEAKASMDALGGPGGYVPPGKDTGPCQYNATTKQTCGNGWTVTLSDFL